jgi:FtsZ-binding cell division protein ZapB
MNAIQDKIQIVQMEINVESSPERKKDLQKELQKLQLKKEIETIRRKIEQLG